MQGRFKCVGKEGEALNWLTGQWAFGTLNHFTNSDDMSEPEDTKAKEAKLVEIISTEILEPGADFNENTDLYGAGLDSMATMQLVIRIEQEFGVRLPANKITKQNFSSVSALARII